jgi:hypothetical protein
MVIILVTILCFVIAINVKLTNWPSTQLITKIVHLQNVKSPVYPQIIRTTSNIKRC